MSVLCVNIYAEDLPVKVVEWWVVGLNFDEYLECDTDDAVQAQQVLKEVQIVSVHGGGTYVQDLWKALSQDDRAG